MNFATSGYPTSRSMNKPHRVLKRHCKCGNPKPLEVWQHECGTCWYAHKMDKERAQKKAELLSRIGTHEDYLRTCTRRDARENTQFQISEARLELSRLEKGAR